MLLKVTSKAACLQLARPLLQKSVYETWHRALNLDRSRGPAAQRLHCNVKTKTKHLSHSLVSGSSVRHELALTLTVH